MARRIGPLPFASVGSLSGCAAVHHVQREDLVMRLPRREAARILRGRSIAVDYAEGTVVRSYDDAHAVRSSGIRSKLLFASG
jgi:hypothetical protein